MTAVFNSYTTRYRTLFSDEDIFCVIMILVEQNTLTERDKEDYARGFLVAVFT